MDPLFAPLPEDLSALTVEELRSYIAEAQSVLDGIAANPAEFVNDERGIAALKAEATEGAASIQAAKAQLKVLTADETTEVEEAEDVETAEVDEDDVAALAELATAAREDGEPEAEEVEPEPEAEAEIVAEVEEPEAVVAAAVVIPKPKPAARLHSRPARSHAAKPPVEEVRVALTAAAEGLGLHLGAEIPDPLVTAEMMIRRRGQFGYVPEGTHGDRIPIARADWSGLYPEERTLTQDIGSNMDKIEAVTADAVINAAFEKRDPESLVASGGLCAPVTPYYQLMMLSVADRPVRAALPAFNADRGGILAGQPASLGSIDDAVGTMTVEEDAVGGTTATKTCQVIDCPAFVETDVETIWHCLQFGNLGARTFPELVAQWNSLVLAAHARTAETLLLDGILNASTAVTAASIGLGATGELPSQVIVAARAMRSRHRMDPNAVLRVMFPNWVLDLLVSDMYRTQFERFDMGPADFVRILRAANVEPTFYIDGATGKGQVFGAQSAAGLLEFPTTVNWFLYPEGSFLYLDGGTLELGLVRDSVLNSTNDFQIFGESFENVAFVGIESLSIISTTCDNGTVAAPHATSCPSY